MQMYGYRLYDCGFRIPRWQFAFGPGQLTPGEMLLERDRATFRPPLMETDLFDPLRSARVVKVADRMMVISGIEERLHKHYAQAWVMLTHNEFQWAGDAASEIRRR